VVTQRGVEGFVLFREDVNLGKKGGSRIAKGDFKCAPTDQS
jgi:hypothetical protein